MVRHGATVLSTEDRFAGATDVALSDEGRAQTERLAARLRRHQDRRDVPAAEREEEARSLADERVRDEVTTATAHAVAPFSSTRQR